MGADPDAKEDEQEGPVLPEAGDPVEFRVKGVVKSVSGDNAIVDIRFVNDEKVSAPKSAKDQRAQDEQDLQDAAAQADEQEPAADAGATK